jgi:c-di-GMP-binding flagellar brake protein YcgR
VLAGSVSGSTLQGGVVPEKAKARIDPRISTEFRVDLEYPWRSGAWRHAQSLDMSASGIYVSSEVDLPLKAQLGCRVYLPSSGGETDRLIDAQAIVVRVIPPEADSREWRYGLYFVELSESDAESIRRFVFIPGEGTLCGDHP